MLPQFSFLLCIWTRTDEYLTVQLPPYFHLNVQYTTVKRRGCGCSFFFNTKQNNSKISVKMAICAFGALSGTLFLRSGEEVATLQ